jgi:hypothetical protein
MEHTKETPQYSKTLPKPQDFFYCCEDETNKLHRVNVLTGEQSSHEVPSHKFKSGCHCTELPGGSLLFTGGMDPAVREVVKIDLLREYAVSALPPMHTARYSHAAVYHSQYLYVLAGFSGIHFLSECERYVCAESRWEVLPALPLAGGGMSAVELENSLYALGGYASDTVQMLCLETCIWEIMNIKLPLPCFLVPCFKIDTQVYLVIKDTLYSFTPFEVKPLKSLPESIVCCSSYYNRGTLYYESGGIIGSLTIGS